VNAPTRFSTFEDVPARALRGDFRVIRRMLPFRMGRDAARILAVRT
jgi:hypothetical protein